MIQQDQQINDAKEKSTDGNEFYFPKTFKLFFSVLKDFSSRSHFDSSSNNQAKIRIQLKYDNGKLFVMVRYANNLVRKFLFIFLK